MRNIKTILIILGVMVGIGLVGYLAYEAARAITFVISALCIYGGVSLTLDIRSLFKRKTT